MNTEDLLREIPLFHNLSKNELSLILRSARRVTYSAGRTIIREGTVGAAFFVIVSGRVEVVKAMAGPSPVVLATFGPGDFFGEIASVKHLPRSASVRALQDTECLVIWRADFDTFISQFPDAAAQVEAKAQARLAQSQPDLEE